MSRHRFDHRHLLRQDDIETTSSTPAQAIYLCTKRHPVLAQKAVEALAGLDVPVTVMASSIDDFPDVNMPFADLDIQIVRPSQFDKTSSLLTHRFSQEACRNLDWDLHIKRNASLAAAKRSGQSRILLLDDDISGLSKHHFETLATRLDIGAAAGFFIEGYEDNSVVGHLSRLVGLPQSSFVSGSCLGINVERTESMFPPIYNEDWLFMLPLLAKKAVGVAGSVHQAADELPALMERVGFQELGDLLAEGAFSGLANDPQSIFDLDHWAAYIDERKRLLKYLSNKLGTRSDFEGTQARRAVAESQRLLDMALPIDCLTYMQSLQDENERWSAALHGRGGAELIDATCVRPRRARHGSRQGSAVDSFWKYPDGVNVTIVCPTLPVSLRSPFAATDDPNYNRTLGLADLDAAIELLMAIKAANRFVDVQIRSSSELTAEMLAGDLVLVGGAAWNEATSRFMRILRFPVRQRTDSNEDTFLISEGGVEVEHGPTRVDESVVEDVALLARASNPLGTSTSVVFCNGVLSRGVLGIVRAFTHAGVASANAQWIQEHASAQGFGVIMRVPVFSGEVVASDITRPENRLFEWTTATSPVDTRRPTNTSA